MEKVVLLKMLAAAVAQMHDGGSHQEDDLAHHAEILRKITTLDPRNIRAVSVAIVSDVAGKPEVMDLKTHLSGSAAVIQLLGAITTEQMKEKSRTDNCTCRNCRAAREQDPLEALVRAIQANGGSVMRF